jgi:hypothetical protein
MRLSKKEARQLREQNETMHKAAVDQAQREVCSKESAARKRRAEEEAAHQTRRSGRNPPEVRRLSSAHLELIEAIKGCREAHCEASSLCPRLQKAESKKQKRIDDDALFGFCPHHGCLPSPRRH